MSLNRVAFYIAAFRYELKSLASRKEFPFVGGIAINDSCNLRCRHCFVSNRHIPDLSFEEIRKGLRTLHGMGMRCLYIEGGEPFLWEDDGKTVADVVELARSVGFRYVMLYTNGTFPILTAADTVFVSLDGTKAVHDAIRGKCHDRIICNINLSHHKRIFANYTITAENMDDISNFCQEIQGIPNLKGVCFYFYTPYQGKDELSLSIEDKKKIVITILSLKKKGHRILNSSAALKSIIDGTWKKPNSLSYLYAENKLFRCCRAMGRNDICEQCGYLGFAELYHLSRMNPDSIMTLASYL